MPYLYLILALYAHSVATAQTCPKDHKIERLGPYSFIQRDVPQVGCSIIASLRDSTTKRSLHFYDKGQLMVFSEGHKKEAGFRDGARTYFILPASNDKKMKMTNLGIAMQIHHSSGIHWMYDENGRIQTEENCKIKTKSQVTAATESTKNGAEGGFFIQSCPNSIIIDSGFDTDRSPASIKTNISRIRDDRGNSCEIVNSKIFNYVGPGQFVIKPEKELATILRDKNNKCTNIDISSLTPQAKRQSSAPQQ